MAVCLILFFAQQVRTLIDVRELLRPESRITRVLDLGLWKPGTSYYGDMLSLPNSKARDFSNVCAVRTLMREGRICEGPRLAKCVRCASRSYGLPKALAAVLGVRSGRPLLQRKTVATHSISNFVDQVTARELWSGRSPISPARRVIIPDALVRRPGAAERP